MHLCSRKYFFIACAIAFVFSSPAYAALYLCNPEIKGDSTAIGYEECIDIASVQDGVDRTMSGAGGGGAGVSAPHFAEITVTKLMDQSSLPLRREAISGGPMDWTIHFVSGAGPESCEYYSIELRDALISSHSMSSAGDRPSESLSLYISRISYSYYPTKPDGSCGAAISWCWDVGKQAAC